MMYALVYTSNGSKHADLLFDTGISKEVWILLIP